MSRNRTNLVRLAALFVGAALALPATAAAGGMSNPIDNGRLLYSDSTGGIQTIWSNGEHHETLPWTKGIVGSWSGSGESFVTTDPNGGYPMVWDAAGDMGVMQNSIFYADPQ